MESLNIILNDDTLFYLDSMEEYNLSEANILKLKKLSIVSLAQQSKVCI